MLLRFFIFIQNILIPPIIPFQSWYEIYSTFSSAWTAIICFAFVFSSFSITSFLFSESNDVWKNNNRKFCYSYLNMFFWSLIIFQNIFTPPPFPPLSNFDTKYRVPLVQNERQPSFALLSFFQTFPVFFSPCRMTPGRIMTLICNNAN